MRKFHGGGKEMRRFAVGDLAADRGARKLDGRHSHRAFGQGFPPDDRGRLLLQERQTGAALRRGAVHPHRRAVGRRPTKRETAYGGRF